MTKESPFGKGTNSRLNACVGENGGPYKYLDYAHGYFQAGDALVEKVVQNQTTQSIDIQIDAVIYPLLYLYRQGTELTLKHFVNRDTVKASHDLRTLWEASRTYVEELLTKAYNETDCRISLKSIDSFISKMHELDPTGMVARFPEDHEKNNFLQDYSLINIEPLYHEACEYFNIMNYITQVEEEYYSS